MMHWFKRTLVEHKGFLLFVALMLIFRSAIADWNVVPTGSMQPTIEEGDYVLIDKLAYDLRVPFTLKSLHTNGHPERGDIIVFESARADKRLVKRVIGVPGDVISMRHNQLTINGHALSYTPQETTANLDLTEALFDTPHTVRWAGKTSDQAAKYATFDRVAVPANHYLAMGDNRDQSADSRVFGFVPRNEIIGRTERVLMSFDLDNYLAPRWARFGRRLDAAAI